MKLIDLLFSTLVHLDLTCVSLLYKEQIETVKTMVQGFWPRRLACAMRACVRHAYWPRRLACAMRACVRHA